MQQQHLGKVLLLQPSITISGQEATSQIRLMNIDSTPSLSQTSETGFERRQPRVGRVPDPVSVEYDLNTIARNVVGRRSQPDIV
jgi:hypothetical protein